MSMTSAHEVLHDPHPGWVWWWRIWTVVVSGYVLSTVAWVLLTRSAGGGWFYVLSVTAVVCLGPIAASTWTRAPQPYAYDRTMLVLSRALAPDPDQRLSVHRALRRGRAADISSDHIAYAQARTSKTNRELVAAPGFVGPTWGQVLYRASGEIGSPYFWLALSMAALATTFSAAMIVLQRRREHTVRLAVERER
ncbi:hypothetical protein [Pseudonocardia sp. ICBG162]|uniref:hypothetical protein n=1 Tax=Pseudonocardia sp. ICBG162 TaxID=2846761 RepID=UPI001CF6AA29|nr:hypothetical protein [Pseudonocardia sp. ICBG162]